MVPALIISAAEQSGVVHAATVVDVGQIVVDATDVREVDVLLHDAFAAVHQRSPVLTPRYCNTVHTIPSNDYVCSTAGQVTVLYSLCVCVAALPPMQAIARSKLLKGVGKFQTWMVVQGLTSHSTHFTIFTDNIGPPIQPLRRIWPAKKSKSATKRKRRADTPIKVIQGHPRSSRSVPIESPYATSY